MKKNLFFLTVCFISTAVNGQNSYQKCHFNEKTENLSKSRNEGLIRNVVTIPVVFHVVYHDSTENIPDTQIISQLYFMNKDFRRLNVDTANTPSAFKSIAADTKIQFCLASQDPNGNATSGITRTYTDTVEWTWTGLFANSKMKYDSTGGKNAWNTNNYFNIWITNITSAGGYSTSSASHGYPTDGIVINPSYIGNDRLLTHEAAHYLNLRHIWGAWNNCIDDLINDTPLQYTANYGCPTFPKTDSCSPSYPGIMFMNFMDYTSSSCQNIFTQGQADRMMNTIVNDRNSLLNSPACDPPTGIRLIEYSKTIIKIFPNPFSTKTSIFFQNSTNENHTITVYDTKGQLVRKIKNITTDKVEIERKKLTSGLYYFQLCNDRQIRATGKLLVE